jgi:hypothetical protein
MPYSTQEMLLLASLAAVGTFGFWLAWQRWRGLEHTDKARVRPWWVTLLGTSLLLFFGAPLVAFSTLGMDFDRTALGYVLGAVVLSTIGGTFGLGCAAAVRGGSLRPAAVGLGALTVLAYMLRLTS